MLGKHPPMAGDAARHDDQWCGGRSGEAPSNPNVVKFATVMQCERPGEYKFSLLYIQRSLLCRCPLWRCRR